MQRVEESPGFRLVRASNIALPPSSSPSVTVPASNELPGFELRWLNADQVLPTARPPSTSTAIAVAISFAVVVRGLRAWVRETMVRQERAARVYESSLALSAESGGGLSGAPPLVVAPDPSQGERTQGDRAEGGEQKTDKRAGHDGDGVARTWHGGDEAPELFAPAGAPALEARVRISPGDEIEPGSSAAAPHHAVRDAPPARAILEGDDVAHPDALGRDRAVDQQVARAERRAHRVAAVDQRMVADQPPGAVEPEAEDHDRRRDGRTRTGRAHEHPPRPCPGPRTDADGS